MTDSRSSIQDGASPKVNDSLRTVRFAVWKRRVVLAIVPLVFVFLILLLVSPSRNGRGSQHTTTTPRTPSGKHEKQAHPRIYTDGEEKPDIPRHESSYDLIQQNKPIESLRTNRNLRNEDNATTATVTFNLPPQPATSAPTPKTTIRLLGQDYPLDTKRIGLVEGSGGTGTISTDIALLTGLASLVIPEGLTGTIPTEVGLLTALNRLRLSSALTGTIPSQLGQLTVLRDLYIRDTDLTGTIPSEIGRLTAVSFLDLRQNQLSGAIPTEIDRMTALKEILLDGNDLSGTLSPGVCSLGITALSVDCEKVSCPAPACSEWSCGCSTTIRQKGFISFSLYFAERGPNEAELEQLAAAIFLSLAILCGAIL